MKNFTAMYRFAYTTTGKAHRFDPVHPDKPNVGNIYIRNAGNNPAKLIRIEIERID